MNMNDFTRDINEINEIILHSTNSPADREWPLEKIWYLNKSKGYSEENAMAYHFVIYLDGSIHAGLPLNIEGAHAKGHNVNSIGIAYVGGYVVDNGLHFCDTRNEAQKQSMRKLLVSLKKQFPNAVIKGHSDVKVSHTRWGGEVDCPGFDAMAEYADLNNMVNETRKGE